MYRSSILFLATFAVFVGNIAGQEADIKDSPYLVSVRIRDVHVCGGSIIGTSKVLTAAHCIKASGLSEKQYSIQYGLTRIGSTGNVIIGTKLVVHEKYSGNPPDYDIGLIILASDIPQGANTKLISLATVRPATGTNAVVTGWGAGVLQSVTVKIVSNGECQKSYSGAINITDRILCAGFTSSATDHCQGDSGGPLVVNNQLVGVVAGGAACEDPNAYGVYNDVASLRDWILKTSLSICVQTN